MSGGPEVPPQGPGDRAHGIPSGYGHSLQPVYLFFITQLPAPPSTGTAVLLRYHMGCRLWVSGTVVTQRQEPLEQWAVGDLALALLLRGQL